MDELNRNVMKLKKGMFVFVEYWHEDEILLKKGVLASVNLDLCEIHIVKTKIDLKKVIWLEIDDKY